MSKNQWNFIACTFDGTEPDKAHRNKIYLNGERCWPLSNIGNIPTSTFVEATNSSGFAYLTFGTPGSRMYNGTSGGRWFGGFFCEVGIWQRTLVPHEIKRMYEIGRPLE